MPSLLQLYGAAAKLGIPGLKDYISCLENETKRAVALLGVPQYLKEDSSGTIKIIDVSRLTTLLLMSSALSLTSFGLGSTRQSMYPVS